MRLRNAILFVDSDGPSLPRVQYGCHPATGIAAIRADGELDRWLRDRYASWESGIGAEIEAGKHDFKSLEQHMLAKGDITPNKSGRQEAFENLVNRFVL